MIKRSAMWRANQSGVTGAQACMPRWPLGVRYVLGLLALWLAGCGPSAPPPAADLLGGPPAQASGFAQARPGMEISLPRDLGSHSDYQLEWWYLTANLHSAEGEAFGVQWTLFRFGLHAYQDAARPAGWYRDDVWLAHAALSRPGQHRFASKWARGGTGQAGVTLAPFSAWIDDWQLGADLPSQGPRVDRQPGESGPGDWLLQARADNFAFRLQATPSLPPVRHGADGFSAKSSKGGGSMYFSFPALTMRGQVTLDGATHDVSGQGWFDREWSSQLLQPDQQGWDWLALHLDDGRRLMLFRVRGDSPFYAASLIQASGSSKALGPDEFSLQPLAYRDSQHGRVPVRWQVTVPAQGIALEVSAWPGEYWNPGRLRYWEGPVDVSGSHHGEGYLEMTGYGD